MAEDKVENVSDSFVEISSSTEISESLEFADDDESLLSHAEKPRMNSLYKVRHGKNTNLAHF